MKSELLPSGVVEAFEYLRTGGLGEVIGLTSIALKEGAPKVQSDTDMAMALGLLAGDALEAEEYARRLAQALHDRLFPDAADWKPLPTLMGLLTQIDNMTAPAA